MLITNTLSNRIHNIFILSEGKELICMDVRNKYKEDSPINTINSLQKIIAALNLQTQETWMESIPGAYSVIINILGTKISSNGKGVTKELAKASGYAELIERIQNFLHFRLSDRFSVLGTKHFALDTKFAIHESDISHLRRIRWMKMVLKEDLWPRYCEIWSKITSDKKTIYERYININNDEDVIEIPYLVLDYYYGSNGMASGNSIDEAIAQSLAEIIERHVVSRIINPNNTVMFYSNITEYVIQKNKNIEKLLFSLKQEGLDVSIMDYSFGNLFPAIGLVTIDKINLRYFINIGSHPDLEIAVERAITELLQGRKVDSINDMTYLNQDFRNVKFGKNLSDIFHNNVGIYPPNCLYLSHKAERLPSIWENQYNNNKEMVDFYEELFVKKLNLNIYIKNYSYLGFPTIHIIIPGFSEVADIDDVFELKKLSEIEEFKKDYCYITKNVENLNETDVPRINRVKKFWENNKIKESLNLNEVFNLPVNPLMPNKLLYTNKSYFLLVLYTYNSEYTKAYYESLNYIDYLKKRNGTSKLSAMIDYFSIISMILYFMSYGYSEDNIISFFNGFNIDKEYIFECINDLKKDTILRSLPKITCPECDICDLNEICFIENEKNLLNQLKHQYNMMQNL